MTTFRTITGMSQGEYKEKGSRFYAFAFPVTNPEEVQGHLLDLKKQHHKARHHCFAYRLGPQGKEFRAYDDGEPKHSAGDPILGQILSFELTDVLIVVIRYFGGTKLGISGLIGAYREAARQALQAGTIAEKEVFQLLLVTFLYPEMNRVMRLVKELRLTMVEQHFEHSCELTLQVPESKIDQVKGQLEQMKLIKFRFESG